MTLRKPIVIEDDGSYSEVVASDTLLSNAIEIDSLTASTALASDANKNVVSSSTTATELGYVHGVTSSIQTQLNGKEQIFNGIQDYTKVTPSYVQATRTLTVTYTTGALVWVNGVGYAKTGTETVTHAATSGIWYAYYDSTGTLTISQTFWDILSTAQLVYIRYNAATAVGSMFFEEHPGPTGMDNAVHKNLHITRGTQYVSGLSVTGYSLSTNGTAALQYAVSSGVIADEDLFLSIAGVVTGGPYSVWYRSGSDAAGEYTTSDANTVPLLQNGTDALWNQLSGGSWSTVAMYGNKTQYMNMWMAAAPRLDASGNAYLQSFLIAGQAIYASTADALAATPGTELNFGTFPFPEIVVFQQFVLERSDSASPYHVQMTANQAVRFSAVQVITTAATVAATNVTVNTAAFTKNLSSADSTVQHALNTLDQLTAGGGGITTLTGDVTASGTGSVAATIANNAVTNAKLAQAPTLTMKGNNTGGTANVSDLTVAQVWAMLNTGAVGYSLSFTNANLSSGILTVSHGLNQLYISAPTIYNNSNQVIVPNKITAVDANTCTIDLTKFGTITGTWNLYIPPTGVSSNIISNDPTAGGASPSTTVGMSEAALQTYIKLQIQQAIAFNH